MTPLLSICIPTHHGRAAALAVALDSVLEQLPSPDGEVEIVVCDNASQDATADVVQERRAHHLGVLSYHRNPTNIGFAHNIVRAAEHAAGRFCWLLGSDDALAAGGVENVLATLRAHPELTGLSVNRRNLDSALEHPSLPDPPALLSRELQAQPRAYADARAALEDVGLYLTYISGQVVDREHYLAVAAGAPPPVVEPGYFMHLYIFARMLVEQPRWRWEPRPVVLNRTENDALVEHLDRQVARYQVETLRDRAVAWAAALGRDSDLYALLVRRSRAYWGAPRNVLGFKLGAAHTRREDLLLLRGFGRHFAGDPRFWLVSLPALLAPHQVAKAIHRLFVRRR
ncbi:MAG: glycosyltransferase family A protein [Solirubrobacteraceae bacterium]